MFEDGRQSGLPPPADWASEEWAQDLQMASAFLTRVPVRTSAARPFSLSRAGRAFPIVGAFIGAATGVIMVLCHWLGMGALLSAALGIGAGVALTGALHEDGLADTADGFWGAASKAEKLRIMRDSRIGTFGVLALVFSVIIRLAAAAELVESSALQIVAGMISAESLSRHAMIALMATTEPARDEGMAVAAGRPSPDSMRTSLILALLIGVPGLWLAGGIMGLVLAGGFALLAFLAVRGAARRFIGGHSGDVCGAMQQVVALAVLAGLAMTAGL
jgi:adenosylcobinamide-GDP ribazoletransferase